MDPADHSEKKPHSAEYFGEGRDYWWNADFLALMARRLRFEQVGSALDVGCGVGHWGRALLPHLPDTARLTGIDPEAKWTAAAQTAAEATGFGDRTRYIQGTAERIPLPENSFDMVTCQTVLIHVRDCRVALREMVRVLRPGGLLLATEPNNLANAMVLGTARLHESIYDRVRLVRFQAVCERGKEAVGEGHNSVGDLIPGLMGEAGLTGVQVYLSDRASPMMPPYEEPAQRAERDQCVEWAGREFWIWDEEDTRRYFVAGGGAVVDFGDNWRLALRVGRVHAAAMKAGTYHCGGGAVTYLVSGRKMV